MLNISDESLQFKEVEMRNTNLLYCKPSKLDLKAFKKALIRNFENDKQLKKVVVALYINTEEGVRPYFTIGIRANKSMNSYIDSMKNALSKQFYSNTYFDFVDLNKDNKSGNLLEKQGETIIDRGIF